MYYIYIKYIYWYSRNIFSFHSDYFLFVLKITFKLGKTNRCNYVEITRLFDLESQFCPPAKNKQKLINVVFWKDARIYTNINGVFVKKQNNENWIPVSVRVNI